MDVYQVGIAQTDITPPAGIFLAGFADRSEPSEGAYHPLRAVAVAIDDGKTPLLIVGAELLGFYDKTPAVRSAIKHATGLRDEQIILSGSHTHCGPSIREWDKRHGPLNETYIASLIDRIADIAQKAWQSREPAQLQFGHGTCDMATCRRKPDPDSPPKIFETMLPYPPGHSDHGVPVVTIESPDGEMRGIIFSYACHPTSRGGLLAGGDYVAYALDSVEKQYPGATACFLQGCGGDQKPRPADPRDETFGSRSVEQVTDIGNELGAAVHAVIASGAMEPIEGDIAITRDFLDLETEPLDSDEIEKAKAPDKHWLIHQWAEYHEQRIAQGLPEQRIVPFEMQTVRFGDTLAIITLAGEMSAEYSLRLKKELAASFKGVLPLGYTNDIVGYVPVQRQIPEGGYEVWRANQIHKRSGPYVARTEDQIHKAVHAALDI
jgi:hypothetical protein